MTPSSRQSFSSMVAQPIHPPRSNRRLLWVRELAPAGACRGVLLASTWERQSPDWRFFWLLVASSYQTECPVVLLLREPPGHQKGPPGGWLVEPGRFVEESLFDVNARPAFKRIAAMWSAGARSVSEIDRTKWEKKGVGGRAVVL